MAMRKVPCYCILEPATVLGQWTKRPWARNMLISPTARLATSSIIIFRPLPKQDYCKSRYPLLAPYPSNTSLPKKPSENILCSWVVGFTEEDTERRAVLAYSLLCISLSGIPHQGVAPRRRTW